MTAAGVVYVAIGEAARREAERSIEALNRVCREMATHTIQDNGGYDSLDTMQASRWCKINLDKTSPYDLTAYLDADTRPQGDITAALDILADGFDLAIVPSEQQGDEMLWHVSAQEREATLTECGQVLQLQCGVMFFCKNARVRRFFGAWRSEWLRWRGQDQGAFLRALRVAPLKIWLLGRPWNGGAVIQHLFGRVRQ